MDKVMPIRDVYARTVLDPRGDPAVETEVLAGESMIGRALISAEKYKADAMETARAGAEQINGLAEMMIGRNVLDQEEVDHAIARVSGVCGENEDKTGGCGMGLGLSLAAARAAAGLLGLPLFRYLGGIQFNQVPHPLVTLADSRREARDGLWLAMPAPEESGKTKKHVRKQIRMCVKIYHATGQMLAERGLESSVGDDGGWRTGNMDREKIPRLIEQAVELAGYRPHRDVTIFETGAGNSLSGLPNTVLIDGTEATTLTELMERIHKKRSEGYRIVAGKGGAVTDPFLADVAAACQADLVWAGAPCRGECVAVYNRMMYIEEQVGVSVI